MRPQFERLTDDQWEGMKVFLKWQHPRKYDLREILNAILWITRTGTQWRNLDISFPPWKIVYYYFETWGKRGIFEKMCNELNMKERIQSGRYVNSSIFIIDSQSIKLSPIIYEHRGIDANKKVNGRKRQLLVDVLERIWNASVHAAHKHNGIGGLELLENITEKMPGVKKIMGDKAYRGTFAAAVENLGLFLTSAVFLNKKLFKLNFRFLECRFC